MTEALRLQGEVSQLPAFNEFVLKLNSRCQLQPLLRKDRPTFPGAVIGGCDYCYEFSENEDWKDEPARMELDVVKQAALRIDEHAWTHGLESVRIILHGGEPLSLSAEYLDEVLTIIRNMSVASYIMIQTNGLAIDEEKLAVLKRHGVQIGISLDGDELANDRHRLRQNGRSSFDSVVRGVNRTKASGQDVHFLSTIDTRNSPEHTLEWLAGHDPAGISMFPQHANHMTGPRPAGPEHLPLGAWEYRSFMRWYYWHIYHPSPDGSLPDDARQELPKLPFEMPLFSAHLLEFRGGKSEHERVGNRYTHEIFVTPSGKWQRLDTLKATGNRNVYKTGMTIFDHSLDEVGARDPGFIARRLASTMGGQAVAAECEACPLFRYDPLDASHSGACGAGYYIARYKDVGHELTPDDPPEHFVETFKNPDADCGHLQHLLGRMALVVEKSLKAPRGSLTGSAPIPREKINLIMQNLGTCTKVGDYLETMQTARLWHAHDFCPNVPGEDPEALVKLVRLLNSQAVLTPDGHSKREDPKIPRELWLPLLRFIRSDDYGGRLGLYAYKAFHRQQLYGNLTLAFRGAVRAAATLAPKRDGTYTNDEIWGLHKDSDDAIVQALLSPDQPALQGLMPPIRCGDKFIVTSHAIQALYRNRAAVAGLVYPVSLDGWQRESAISAGNAAGYAYAVKPPEQLPAPIRVRFDDLPRDLLVLEIPGASQAETEALLTEWSDHRHTSNPYELAELLMRRPRPAYLLPLSGFWTPHTNSPSWHIPDKRDTREAMSADQKMIERWIGEHLAKLSDLTAVAQAARA